MGVKARRVPRISTLASLTALVVAGAAGCASSHTSHASAAASSSLSEPTPAISPSLSASTAAPSSISTSPAPAPATFTPTTPPPSTWPPTATMTASGNPPTLHLSDADATKTYVVAIGTIIDVTVQLRPGDGVSIDPPSSADEDILSTVSVDTAAADTTHGVFQAVVPGDSAIIVRENPPAQPCPSGVPSPCAAAAPRGFDFYITIVPAKS